MSSNISAKKASPLTYYRRSIYPMSTRRRFCVFTLFSMMMGISGLSSAGKPVPSWLTPPIDIPKNVASGPEVEEGPELSVSADGGRAIAIWSSQGALKASLATISDGVLTWGSVTTISDIDQWAFSPRIALSADGSKAIAIWSEGQSDYCVLKARSATINVTGILWSPGVTSPKKLTDQKECPSYPQVVISEDGTKATAIWSYGGFSDGVVSSSASLVDDTYNWGGVKVIDTPSSSERGSYPRLALSKDGNKAIVLWVTYGELHSAQGVVSGNESSWGTSLVYSGGASQSDTVNAAYQIAFSENGHKAIAIWKVYERIPYSKNILMSATANVYGLSAEWSSPEIIWDQDGTVGYFNEVSLSGDGRKAIAVWTINTRQTNSILQSRVATIDQKASVWAPILNLAGTEDFSSKPQVSISNDGSKSTVIWLGDGLETRSGLFTNNSETWSDVIQVTTSSQTPQSPRLALSDDGTKATAIWRSDPVGQTLSSSSAVIDYHVNPPTPENLMLSVSKTGSGSVSSVPTGITCGTICSAPFGAGTQVTLTASAGAGYTFSSWSGPCSGSGVCTVTMDGAKSVGAIFTVIPVPKKYTLNSSTSGSGTITSIPAGITCGSTCSSQFPDGSTVSLIAQPDYGHAFSGWSGACSGTGTCAVTMNSDISVSANFIELSKYPVKITKPSTGVIRSEPAGILCGGPNKQCISSFSSAKLTAIPNLNYEVVRWKGCQTVEGSTCYIKPTGTIIVSAVFKKLPKYTVKITKNTFGSITSTPAGLNCPDKKKICSVKFWKGAKVILAPAPQQGRSFSGWTGACSGVDPCTFLMNGNKAVGAVFQ